MGPMDRRDLPVAPMAAGGLTLREEVARDMLKTLVAKSDLPPAVKPRNGEDPGDARMRQREAIDRWVENRAELAVSLADGLFDFLSSPRDAVSAQVRKQVRENGDGD